MTQQQMLLAKDKIIDEIIASNERAVMRMYRTRRDEVQKTLQMYYGKYLVDVPKANYYSTLSAYNRLQEMEKEFKGIYVKLNNGARSSVTAAQRQTFTEAFYRGQYTMTMFSDRIGRDIKFQALNDNVRDFAVTGDDEVFKKIRGVARERAEKLRPPAGETLSQMLNKHNAEGVRRVIQTVKQGLVTGESYTRQAKKIKDVFDGNASNALRVIRTEGNRNANAGAFYNSQVLSQQIPIQRMWVATLDLDTRDRHRSLDGQVVGVNEPFTVNGLSAMYPGDFGEPALDINCRCTVIDLVGGVPPQARRGKDPVTGKSEIGGYENYGEWLKRHNL